MPDQDACDESQDAGSVALPQYLAKRNVSPGGWPNSDQMRIAHDVLFFGHGDGLQQSCIPARQDMDIEQVCTRL